MSAADWLTGETLTRRLARLKEELVAEGPELEGETVCGALARLTGEGEVVHWYVHTFTEAQAMESWLNARQARCREKGTTLAVASVVVDPDGHILLVCFTYPA